MREAGDQVSQPPSAGCCVTPSRTSAQGLDSQQQGTSESEEREILPTGDLCPLRLRAGKQGSREACEMFDSFR